MLGAVGWTMAGCGESPRHNVTNRGAISEEPTTDALAGSDSALAALVTPLPGTKEAPHWYRDVLRRLAAKPSPGSFFSLRVYRIGGANELSLEDLSLALITSAGTLEAQDIVLDDADARPEARVLSGRGLAAVRTQRLPAGEGFEVWFAVPGAVELRAVQSAKLTVGGTILELAPRVWPTESFTAFAAQARRDWIVGNVTRSEVDSDSSPSKR